MLFSGCPWLYWSRINKCEFEDMQVVEISSRSLEILRIINCSSNGKYEVLFDTPAISVLEYHNDVAHAYSVKNLGHLSEAQLDLEVTSEQWEEDGWNYFRTIAEFVAACSHVATLSLSLNCIEAINSSGRLLPKFSSLCTLTLGDIEEKGWNLLPRLLESSPNLKVLNFERGIFEYKGYTEFMAHMTEHVPRCFSSSLYKIELEEFKWKEDDLKLVEHFLNIAKVLRQMKISSNLFSVKQLSMSRKLLMLTKHSTLREIDIQKEKTKILEFSLM
ncbi:unnamed protein product [Ilex paraguariensis]|uniref:FBD domain-containing protein n=1 Tax=Ilex paraguariensis TaxID=185542 RepID=A0ABC8RB51_9AQUA